MLFVLWKSVEYNLRKFQFPYVESSDFNVKNCVHPSKIKRDIATLPTLIKLFVINGDGAQRFLLKKLHMFPSKTRLTLRICMFITKTRLFKYTGNFTSKNWKKKSDKNL